MEVGNGGGDGFGEVEDADVTFADVEEEIDK